MCVYPASPPASQGCRPLSSATYTIDSVADGGPVVLALRDERGTKLTPLEALQRELQRVGVVERSCYA